MTMGAPEKELLMLLALAFLPSLLALELEICQDGSCAQLDAESAKDPSAFGKVLQCASYLDSRTTESGKEIKKVYKP